MEQARNNIDKKRMAKNTLLLYVRMLFLLLVGFYTVRLLFTALGVEDYGLYNVIFGIASLFSYLSGAMATTVQRFLCHELGKNNTIRLKIIFSVSIFLFLALDIFLLLCAESVGLWYVTYKLNVPEGALAVAKIVFQFSIIMMLFKTIQIPYIAIVTAYEDMHVFSCFSIMEIVLNLFAAIIIKFFAQDRLVYFSFFCALGTAIIFICYCVYCHCKYSICRLSIKLPLTYFKRMSSFFSWSLCGTFAYIAKQQGLDLLLNSFLGVSINASFGIANRVGSAVNQLVVGFQKAFIPQILKAYTNAEKNHFLMLLQSCSKYSFLLLWLMGLPVLLQTDFLLNIWLGENLPKHVGIFTKLVILSVILEAMSAPMCSAVQAVGRIKRYQIEISCLTASSFILSFIVLKLGGTAWLVALINTIVSFFSLLYRLFYLQREISLSVKNYFMHVLLPVVGIGITSYCAGEGIKIFFSDRWFDRVIFLFTVCIVNFVLILLIGLSSNERSICFQYIGKVNKYAKKKL